MENAVEKQRQILSLAAIAVFFLCFKPLIALTQYHALDDLGYISMTANALGLDYPQAPPNSYPPGVILAWLPAGLLTLVSGWILGTPDIVALPIFVGLSSYAYWCGSLFLLSAMMRTSAAQPLVALLGVPVLYYATHRTTMVHAPEMLFALLTAWFVLKKDTVRSIGCALMVFALRLNDVPILLFALAPAIEAARQNVSSRRLMLAGGAILAAATAYVIWLGFFAGYNRFNLTHMVNGFSLSRIPVVMFGGDWGLVWTAPAWLLCLMCAFVWWRQLSSASKLAGLWMLCELIICIAWPGNGSDFGYRYLIGSYAAAMFVALDIRRVETSGVWWRSIRTAWVFSACWLTWVSWIYKERPEFTPYQTLDRLWTHPELMWNSLMAVFSPATWLIPIPHSTLGALYFTIVQPAGSFALPGGVRGAQFQILAATCVLLLALLPNWRPRHNRQPG